MAPAPGGVTVRLKVTPKASREGIGAVAADGEPRLGVRVAAAPEGGKANAAVVRLLAKAWRVPRSAVSVVRGQASRRKTLFVAGPTAALMARLEPWMRERHD